MTEEKKMQLVDWLDDLCVRFIVNLPQEELQAPERICFQIEEAQWFYEDFIRPLDPSLPSLALADFSSRILKHCPLTSGYSDELHQQAFRNFMNYKTRVPVRGALMLNEDMDKILLVKGWKKNATWSFPRGKINKDEDDLVCAIREVWEETGYDIEKAGLVPTDRNVHSIDVTMREQNLKMFVFRGVPLDTSFETQTRKEIGKIGWFPLKDLPTFNNKKRSTNPIIGEADTISPNKLYMVAPFLQPLKKWITQQKKLDAGRPSHLAAVPDHLQHVPSDAPEESDREFQPSAPQHLSNTEDELMRLLLPQQPPPVQPQKDSLFIESLPANGLQADALLAMLRGSSSALAPPQTSAMLPQTPMDQILEPPLEPRSPHVNHVQHTPRVMRQPPPSFPLSPNSQHIQDATRSMNQLGLNGPQILPHPGYAPFSSQPPPFIQEQQLPGFPQRPVQGGQPHPSQFSGPLHMMPSLQPQGHGAIAHGPAAPKASQLPAPSLNNHTMSLLNAFKAPSLQQQQQRQHQQQMYVQAQMQQSHAQNASPHMAHMKPLQAASSGNGPSQPGAHPQHNMPDQTSQAALPRSTHQNSLLDMFRSPTAAKAAPAVHSSASLPDQGHLRSASLQATQPAQSPQAAVASPLSEAPKQRSATMAMMTRTLPKAKVPDSPKSKIQHKGGEPNPGMFPAKHALRQAQLHSVGDMVPEGQLKMAGHEASKPPMTILSRPGSMAGSAAGATPPPHVASSPRKGRTSKMPDQNAGPNFTILQRPSPTKLADTSKSHSIKSPPPPHNEGVNKPFQPQLLRRPKAEGSMSPLPAGQTASPAQGGGDQRNTLLALFAKSEHGRGRSIDASRGIPGPPSSGSASPLPSDPAAFRSRIASNASAVSNGDGLKSPSTPVEAKGFLLDYLNGVVKGEHYRGAKRPQL